MTLKGFLSYSTTNLLYVALVVGIDFIEPLFRLPIYMQHYFGVPLLNF